MVISESGSVTSQFPPDALELWHMNYIKLAELAVCSPSHRFNHFYLFKFGDNVKAYNIVLAKVDTPVGTLEVSPLRLTVHN